MKKIIALLLALVVAFSFVACSESDKNDETVTETEVTETKEQDFMEKYLSEIDAEKRTAFLVFFESSRGFCNRLKRELKNVEFVGEFEFDPSKKDQIPSELSAIFDFTEFSIYPNVQKFKDIKMKVVNTDVSLSYDGYEFFPSTYSYTDVMLMVEGFNVE